jgi:hypothetical protein
LVPHAGQIPSINFEPQLQSTGFRRARWHSVQYFLFGVSFPQRTHFIFCVPLLNNLGKHVHSTHSYHHTVYRIGSNLIYLRKMGKRH